MKKDKMIVVNGGKYGIILIPCPATWDKMTNADKDNYLKDCKNNATRGKFGNSGHTSVPSAYKAKYELIYA